MIFNEIKKLLKYLFKKTVEIKDMEPKDAVLGKVVIDIHNKKLKSEFILAPLYDIKQIHAIDRENAIKSTEKRIASLNECKADLLKTKKITREVLAKYLPSISWLKVVKARKNTYIAFEGNGRLVAMQKVFTPGDGILVEVEHYTVRQPKKILRRMNRVRKMNKFSKL